MYKRQQFILNSCTFQGNESLIDYHCLLYTSDAADELDGVDLGGRRIIKKRLVLSLIHI
ncbi:hypothetical protein JMUB7518_28090 [Staphylococcus aureus]